MESTLRQLEREKALLQHKNAEYQRKADHEADKTRNLENDVNSLKDQLEDLKKRNQSSQISTEKVNQLQKQVGWSVWKVLSYPRLSVCVLQSP